MQSWTHEPLPAFMSLYSEGVWFKDWGWSYFTFIDEYILSNLYLNGYLNIWAVDTPSTFE